MATPRQIRRMQPIVDATRGRVPKSAVTAVTIKVDGKGKVTVDPYYAVFKKGQQLMWRTNPKGLPWAVAFHCKRSPTRAVVIRGNGEYMRGRPVVRREEGHFPYTVAVASVLGRRGTIFLDTACPEIIIR